MTNNLIVAAAGERRMSDAWRVCFRGVRPLPWEARDRSRGRRSLHMALADMRIAIDGGAALEDALAPIRELEADVRQHYCERHPEHEHECAGIMTSCDLLCRAGSAVRSRIHATRAHVVRVRPIARARRVGMADLSHAGTAAGDLHGPPASRVGEDRMMRPSTRGLLTLVSLAAAFSRGSAPGTTGGVGSRRRQPKQAREITAIAEQRIARAAEKRTRKAEKRVRELSRLL